MATPAKKKLPTPSKKPVAKKTEEKVPPFLKSVKAPYVAPKPLPVAKPIAAKPVEKKAPGKVVGIGHNGAPTSVSKTVLKSVVDRIENLEEEKQGTADDIKEVYTEAKAKGLDVKTIRKIVSARRRDKEALRAEKELLDIYLEALDPELAEVLS